MTERDLNDEWARTQLEAWADGSLAPENRKRMAAALAANAGLRAAAQRAVAVRRALRASPPEPMPAGLRRRLLAIPGSRNVWRGFALPVAASVMAAIVAVLWLQPDTPPQADPRVAAAAQELEVAMRYLQKSARFTQNEVTNAVGSGLRDAVAATRAAVGQDTDESGG